MMQDNAIKFQHRNRRSSPYTYTLTIEGSDNSKRERTCSSCLCHSKEKKQNSRNQMIISDQMEIPTESCQNTYEIKTDSEDNEIDDKKYSSEYNNIPKTVKENKTINQNIPKTFESNSPLEYNSVPSNYSPIVNSQFINTPKINTPKVFQTSPSEYIPTYNYIEDLKNLQIDMPEEIEPDISSNYNLTMESINKIGNKIFPSQGFRTEESKMEPLSKNYSHINQTLQNSKKNKIKSFSKPCLNSVNDIKKNPFNDKHLYKPSSLKNIRVIKPNNMSDEYLSTKFMIPKKRILSPNPISKTFNDSSLTTNASNPNLRQINKILGNNLMGTLAQKKMNLYPYRNQSDIYNNENIPSEGIDYSRLNFNYPQNKINNIPLKEDNYPDNDLRNEEIYNYDDIQNNPNINQNRILNNYQSDEEEIGKEEMERLKYKYDNLDTNNLQNIKDNIYTYSGIPTTESLANQLRGRKQNESPREEINDNFYNPNKEKIPQTKEELIQFNKYLMEENESVKKMNFCYKQLLDNCFYFLNSLSSKHKFNGNKDNDIFQIQNFIRNPDDLTNLLIELEKCTGGQKFIKPNKILRKMRREKEGYEEESYSDNSEESEEELKEIHELDFSIINEPTEEEDENIFRHKQGEFSFGKNTLGKTNKSYNPDKNNCVACLIGGGNSVKGYSSMNYNPYQKYPKFRKNDSESNISDNLEISKKNYKTTKTESSNKSKSKKKIKNS
ncbi:MAG: hypothetical protein MJ252_02465 [archaeon]|nr:hypothetical protein [archaeon]